MFPETVERLRSAGCVFAEDEARLLIAAAHGDGELEDMIAQRVSGMPLEQVVGWAEFCGLRIAVDPGVFVPRRRTEFLARQAASLAPPGAVVVDLCCGSGALAAAIGALLDRAGRTASPATGRTASPATGRTASPATGGTELHATDVDPAAVRCARRNLPDAEVHAGDLYEPLPDTLRGRVDILVANVPYVPERDIAFLPAEARLHEARVALDGGGDGLDVLRRVAAEAPRWLAPSGHLLIETSEQQADTAGRAFASSGLTPRITRSPESAATIVIGRRA